MNLIICVSFCVIIFVTCLSKELKLPHVVSTNESHDGDCFLLAGFLCLPFSLSVKGLFDFTPLDLKRAGNFFVLSDCVEGACPLSSRREFWLESHFVLYSADELMGFECVSHCFV